jgi:hypothetical protein
MKFRDNLATMHPNLSFATMKWVHQIIICKFSTDELNSIELFFNTYTDNWEALFMTFDTKAARSAGLSTRGVAVSVQSEQEIDPVLLKLTTNCLVNTISKIEYNQSIESFNRGVNGCLK